MLHLVPAHHGVEEILKAHPIQDRIRARPSAAGEDGGAPALGPGITYEFHHTREGTGVFERRLIACVEARHRRGGLRLSDPLGHDLVIGGPEASQDFLLGRRASQGGRNRLLKATERGLEGVDQGSVQVEDEEPGAG